ncbi:putative ATP-dependent RNA helicase pitchoune [Trichinella murrelli]|uniref:ATP-dependent RNA helicase n=1 Tax=Trichinella murrelli TaxID=144512 RepID=A0A0V0UE73_9BILA|nr:putative ATP-dependent RNA helicase pitchoune [Trichinella murrelli]KRX49726.1 putative ATP-dependent RNA helicase pitchoune [Trichinella murrelli]
MSTKAKCIESLVYCSIINFVYSVENAALRKRNLKRKLKKKMLREKLSSEFDENTKTLQKGEASKLDKKMSREKLSSEFDENTKTLQKGEASKLDKKMSREKLSTKFNENTKTLQKGEASKLDKKMSGEKLSSEFNENTKILKKGETSKLDNIDHSFESVGGILSEKTLKAIYDMGFKNMTEIQEKCIMKILNDANRSRDIVAVAKTGSGKTLAYLILAVEQLVHKKFSPDLGTGCIVVCPSREICIQTHQVMQEMLKYYDFTCAIVIGGCSRQREVEKLSAGATFVIGTPGRLLDHLEKTDFQFKKLKCLIIDEFDRIIDTNLHREMMQILQLLPRKRQTMIFGATRSKLTSTFVKIALPNRPICVGKRDKVEEPTVEGLQQGYVICPVEKRFHFLYTFLRCKKQKKIMVFFSSCASVKFHTELLRVLNFSLLSIHGKQQQQKRTETYHQFREQQSGLLLCTDVAARGLDFSGVDWIVQYDPPDDPNEYIHRVGRTARGEGTKGNAILILQPCEKRFLKHLKQASVFVRQFKFSWNKVADIQDRLENLISNEFFLCISAKEAFTGYVRAYESHHMKDVFNVRSLDIGMVSKSFGFRTPLYIDLEKSEKNEGLRSVGRKKQIRKQENTFIQIQSKKKIRA